MLGTCELGEVGEDKAESFARPAAADDESMAFCINRRPLPSFKEPGRLGRFPFRLAELVAPIGLLPELRFGAESFLCELFNGGSKC